MVVLADGEVHVRLIFLGTSSGTPTRTRNTAAMALILDDARTWLFDCGEAAQHRILACPIRPARINRVLLTHLHGDHCYGLPGLLASVAVHGRHGEPFELIAPEGAEGWIRHTLAATAAGLPFSLRSTPLTGSHDLGLRDGLAITAIPVRHRMPCWAFVVRQPVRPGRFDVQRAAVLGLGEGPLRGQLARGQVVELPDGRRLDPQAEGLIGPPRPGLHLVVVGDTCDASPVIEAATGCDVLIHECTYAAGREEEAMAWGHSTTTMVAQLAARIRPRHLVLTHFSSRYTTGGPVRVEHLVAEVAAACPGLSISAADDLMELPLSPGGDHSLP